MPLWESESKAKEAIWYGIENCDILKISDNEIKWLTNIEDYDESIKIIKNKSKVKMINVTLGKEGSICYYLDKKIFVKAFENKNVVDATGAGDTFCTNIISFILNYGINNLNENKINEMLTYANAAALIITTRKGALCSMPTKKEIEKFILKSK